ncbi:MAG: isoprenylcysteine carboxylmethyltransferase family protein [Myxococcota bacterium]|jgi:protein-S-isoprenylcysteine O-methyltransferase Ste14|nr:isoprenylcysteine carboxylmethyltransferase family protein [Myxococcota bacterium]
MPKLALALYIVWYATSFGVRTFIHWRHTGSTGFKGFHGSPGSLPWCAGVSLSLGFVLVLVAPIAALLDWPGGAVLFESPALHALGAVLVVAGNVGVLLAQHGMGDSWRVGVDESETTALVTNGPFAWVRNPIFSFMGVSLVGLWLLLPNVVAVVAGLLAIAGIEGQVRGVEEPHLLNTHPDSYASYARGVGRFVPGVGRLTSR